MQTFNEGDQLTLFDQDSESGRMFPAHTAAAPRKVRTSMRLSKPSSRLPNQTFMLLDLRPGAGNILGPCWEYDPLWFGPLGTLNTSECPKDVVESSLSQILQDTVPSQYYLSKTACEGILRRAETRGKELPEQLKLALEVQAGLRELPNGFTELKDYPINQSEKVNRRKAARESTLSCEGLSLNGVSGTLTDIQNTQMQTFVTKTQIAFAANQRDEVRDLHGTAGALGAQPGMKQQTFIASFSAGAGASAGGISYSEQVSPTLKGSASGNCMPSVLCLNDQGGSVMEYSEDISGTLRAQEHGHQPLVLPAMLFENHGIDSRYTGPHDVSPTLSARAGTGGNNLPLALHLGETFCIMGNAIDRQPHNGGNGIGYQTDLAYTLTATDHHAVFSRQRVDVFRDDEVASTQSARQHKDATDLIMEVARLDCRNATDNGDLCGTLQKGTSGSSLNAIHPIRYGLLIRRLTPMECERLQGFPDHWTDIPKASDSARYKALGNSVAIPCVEHIIQGLALVLSQEK